jgi:type II secretory pathway component GspD/PulD (secretin)
VETLTIKLKSSDARLVALAIQQAFTQPGEPAGKTPTDLRLRVDDRTNTLVVSGDAADLVSVRRLVAALDNPPAYNPGGPRGGGPEPQTGGPELSVLGPTLASPVGAEKPGPAVFPLRHTNAADLAAILTTMFGDRDGAFRVAADPRTNTLVILSSAANQASIRKVIDELDIPAAKKP